MLAEEPCRPDEQKLNRCADDAGAVWHSIDGAHRPGGEPVPAEDAKKVGEGEDLAPLNLPENHILGLVRHGRCSFPCWSAAALARKRPPLCEADYSVRGGGFKPAKCFASGELANLMRSF